MHQVEIPAYSVFVGDGYIQHAGAEWNGNPCLRLHTYLVPEDMFLPDAINFGLNGSMPCSTVRHLNVELSSNVLQHTSHSCTANDGSGHYNGVRSPIMEPNVAR